MGLVGGWLAASAPLPQPRGAVGALVAVLGLAVAVAGWLGGIDAGQWCAAGVAVGFLAFRTSQVLVKWSGR